MHSNRGGGSRWNNIYLIIFFFFLKFIHQLDIHDVLSVGFAVFNELCQQNLGLLRYGLNASSLGINTD